MEIETDVLPERRSFKMIAVKFISTKAFMTELLVKDTFDAFQFIEGDIMTFNTFHIDGYLQKAYFASDDEIPESLEEFSRWKDIREFVFSLIKGKRTPLSFRLIFNLAPSNIRKLILQEDLNYSPEDVKGLYLNIQFDERGAHCITGTSLTTFTMDRSLDQSWDKMVQKFFHSKNIEYEVQS